MQGTWVVGTSRSGKSHELSTWLRAINPIVPDQRPPGISPGILLLAATGASRHSIELAQYRSTTPLGFCEDEVKLYWPLLVEVLSLPPQFSLRLRPETEQEWAYQLWRSAIDSLEYDARARRLVRRILDLMQLAALSQTPIDVIADRLNQGFADGMLLPISPEVIVTLIQQWRAWCISRGFLTYSLIVEFYGQVLLPHPTYRAQLKDRYPIVIADDIDEYPAMTRSLFETFLTLGSDCAFSFNPDGGVRMGLGADPIYIAQLRQRCEVILPLEPRSDNLATTLQEPISTILNDPINFANLPTSIQTIPTTTRAQLIRRTAETIITAVQSGQIRPAEIAIIGPGLDAISRYAFQEILTHQGIAIDLLHDQRSLVSAAPIRALLTLLALVYASPESPGLGRLIDRDRVAEMLVILAPTIDPVRAGLISDYCFTPDADQPELQSAALFPRWDRLGFQVSHAYGEILQWLDAQKQAIKLGQLTPVILLDRAIQTFLLDDAFVPTLRAFMETAQHYWEVEARITGHSSDDLDSPVGRFIQLLRSETITANPAPIPPEGLARDAITLATVFQYRSSHGCHRWQFWFDAGTPRWLSGVDALFGAPLFLQAYAGQPWTIETQLALDEQRLERILKDLLSRTTEQVFLCYSELATNGQEQMGALLPLVEAATTYGLAGLAGLSSGAAT
jgi:hypothetical protein